MKVIVCRDTTGAYSVFETGDDPVLSVVSGFGVWTSSKGAPIVQGWESGDAKAVLGLAKDIEPGESVEAEWTPPLGKAKAAPAKVAPVAKKAPAKKAAKKPAKKKAKKKASKKKA